ncbi:MAG: YheC/YheD family protein [Firmicutes bacterium]|nr:YheC/YheD family protein [Bacillota bacterium]
MYIDIKCIKNNSYSKTCFISEYIFNSLKLKEGIKYNLHVGQLSKKVYVRPYRINKSKSMYLSEEIIKALYLLYDITLNIFKKDKDIYLGPLIGIIENSRYIDALKKGTPPISATMYRKENRKTNCLFYFLNPRDINYQDEKYKGFYFDNKENKWKQKNFPVPDVIYDRCSVINIVYKLTNKYKDIQLLNSNRRIDKWNLFKRLSKYKEINKYLPKTIVYESFEDIIKMLNKYEIIFLKSFNGCSGIEVMGIEKNENRYILNYFENGLKIKEIYSFDKLKRIVEKFLYKKNFIIQQGISLYKYGDHNMDLRVLIQKDRYDEWTATGYRARIANSSFMITNSCIGGEVKRYKDVYEAITNSNNKNYLPSEKKIGDTTIKIAKYIEKEYGRIGELGMDMAIDKDGKIYLLEANKTPNKRMIDKNDFNKFLSILEYGKYLFKNNIGV